MDILVNVSNQKLKAVTNLRSVVSGTQEFIRFIFNTNGDWDDLTTFAQFRQGDNAYNQYLDEEKAAYLPAEIQPGTCTIMLYGSGNRTIATTNSLDITIDENFLVKDANSTEISLSLYNQLVNRIDEFIADANEAIQKANTSASNADEKAEKAQKSATAATEAAERANNSADFADNAAERADKATEDTRLAIDNANAAADRVDKSVEKATEATENANNATESALSAASSANDAATEARNQAVATATATEETKKATGDANVATKQANDAATTAKSAADSANSAADTANEKAVAAEAAANKVDKSIENANDAADRANSAAQRAEESVTSDSSNQTVTFGMASERAGVQSGDTLAVAFGKLAKYCEDLQPHAFVEPIESTTDLFANTLEGKLPSALAVAGLKDLTPMKLGSTVYTGDLNDMPTGLYVIELSQCTNVPPYTMNMWAHVICRNRFSQVCVFYNGSGGTPVTAVRTFANNAWTNWKQQGIGHGFGDVTQNGLIADALSVHLNHPYAPENKTYYVDRARSTTNLPDDCQWGVREVCWFMEGWVLVRITGYTTYSTQAIWTNVYVNNTWYGWQNNTGNVKIKHVEFRNGTENINSIRFKISSATWSKAYAFIFGIDNISGIINESISAHVSDSGEIKIRSIGNSTVSKTWSADNTGYYVYCNSQFKQYAHATILYYGFTDIDVYKV